MKALNAASQELSKTSAFLVVSSRGLALVAAGRSWKQFLKSLGIQ